MDEESQKEVVIVTGEKFVADDKAIGKEDVSVDDMEDKLILVEEVIETEKNLTTHVEEVTESENQVESKKSPHQVEEDKTNFQFSPEKEVLPESSHTIKPICDGKIADDTVTKNILPVSDEQTKTTEIILYSPSEELLPPKPKKLLVLKPEPAIQFSQKQGRRLLFERKCARNITCTFIIITILLCLVTASYLIGGTWLFLYLEEMEEVSYTKEFSKLKNDTAILLATELRQVKAHEAIWSQYVFKHLDIFEDSLLKSTGLGFLRKDIADGKKRWVYPNTMFYSLSLMTTTGYGSMTPRSRWGRTATVCYSFFGIPLMISWLICMGHFFALCWFWMFDSICCRFCCIGSEDKIANSQAKPKNKATRTKPNSIAPAKDAHNPLTSFNSNNIQGRTAETVSAFNGGNEFQNNEKIEEARRDYEPVSHSVRDKPTTVFQKNFDYSVVDSKLNDLDHAVSIVFAVIFFAVYFVFGSALFALTEHLFITDVLYFNYLMFVSMGPGCYELQDDIAENSIRGNLCYNVYLIFGYITISMIFNLIYMYFYPSSRQHRSRKIR